jgi:tRNA U38,U39,U40 pseudouridine synthase TruA
VSIAYQISTLIKICDCKRTIQDIKECKHKMKKLQNIDCVQGNMLAYKKCVMQGSGSVTEGQKCVIQA